MHYFLITVSFVLYANRLHATDLVRSYVKPVPEKIPVLQRFNYDDEIRASRKKRSTFNDFVEQVAELVSKIRVLPELRAVRINSHAFNTDFLNRGSQIDEGIRKETNIVRMETSGSKKSGQPNQNNVNSGVPRQPFQRNVQNRHNPRYTQRNQNYGRTDRRPPTSNKYSLQDQFKLKSELFQITQLERAIKLDLEKFVTKHFTDPNFPDIEETIRGCIYGPPYYDDRWQFLERMVYILPYKLRFPALDDFIRLQGKMMDLLQRSTQLIIDAQEKFPFGEFRHMEQKLKTFYGVLSTTIPPRRPKRKNFVRRPPTGNNNRRPPTNFKRPPAGRNTYQKPFTKPVNK